MDPVKLGLSLRALRRRKRLTQEQLAATAGVGRMTVQRIERGGIESFTGATVRRIAVALGARFEQQVLWQGEALDRLLDQDHAAIVEIVVRWLRDEGWTTVPEATYVFAGRNGSVDVLAFHPPTGTLLIVEVKSVVPDMQGMLRALHRKVRAAGVLAHDQGWRHRRVARLLVLPDDRTSRRRIAQHAATVEATLPARTREVRAWARRPDGPIGGVLFVPVHARARHRVRATPA